MKYLKRFLTKNNIVHLVMVGLLITLMTTEPSYAQNFNGLETFLGKLVGAITGPIGIAIAALAVMGVGFSFMMGHMDWSYAAAVILGIAVVFGGATFTSTLTKF